MSEVTKRRLNDLVRWYRTDKYLIDGNTPNMGVSTTSARRRTDRYLGSYGDCQGRRFNTIVFIGGNGCKQIASALVGKLLNLGRIYTRKI